MRASRAAELDDSNPWAHLALGWVKRHTDDAVVEYVGGSKVRIAALFDHLVDACEQRRGTSETKRLSDL
jgi:hypothetical protein